MHFGKLEVQQSPHEVRSFLLQSLQEDGLGNLLLGEQPVIEIGAEETVPKLPTGEDIEGTAEIVDYGVNSVTVRTAATTEGYLVLLDAYDPGWTARVDGMRIPVRRANMFFRAVRVPRGEHTVRFAYEPAPYRAGLLFTLAGILLWAGALAAERYLHKEQKV